MLRFSVIVTNVKRVAMAQYSYNFFLILGKRGRNIQIRFRSDRSSGHMTEGVMSPYKLPACLCVFAYSSSSSSLHNMHDVLKRILCLVY